MLTSGVFELGGIGVSWQELTINIRNHLQVNSDMLISAVAKNSATHTGGLRSGNVVLSIAERLLSTKIEARNIVAFIPPNTIVPLEFLRDGRKKLMPPCHSAWRLSVQSD